jgi:hypothetical protein
MVMLLPSTIPALTFYRNSISGTPATAAMLLLSTIPALTIYGNSIS